MKKSKAEVAEAWRAEGQASGKPIEMLKEDHKKVKGLFEQFEKAEAEYEKEEIVKEAIMELKIHASIEEEIFYPAARETMSEDEEDEELMNEADEEHHVVKFLIAELEAMDPGDEHYDAKFIVLAENVRHHIKEEEGEMFPKIKSEEANSEEIGQEMFHRKQQLQEELGASEGQRVYVRKSGKSRGK